MAEEGQQQQQQQTQQQPAQQSPPQQRPVPRRRSTDVAPVQMDATPIAEAIGNAVRSVLEEVFGKEKQEQGNAEGGQQQQQQTTTEQKTKRRGSWFWGGPK